MACPSSMASERKPPELTPATTFGNISRLLHHGHVLKCGPRSWRTKIQSDLRTTEATR